MNIPKIAVGLFLSGLCLPVPVAAPALGQDAGKEPVKIGMITSLSGPGGYLGQDIRDGFQLAIDGAGGKLGGVPVQVVVEDDAAKPGQGKQIADRLLQNQNIKLFTGIVFSNVAGATLPDILDAGAIYVSPNAGPSTFAGKGCNANYFVVVAKRLAARGRRPARQPARLQDRLSGRRELSGRQGRARGLQALL